MKAKQETKTIQVHKTVEHGHISISYENDTK